MNTSVAENVRSEAVVKMSVQSESRPGNAKTLPTVVGHTVCREFTVTAWSQSVIVIHYIN